MRTIFALTLVVLAFSALLVGCAKEQTYEQPGTPESGVEQPTAQEEAVIDSAIPGVDDDIELGELV